MRLSIDLERHLNCPDDIFRGFARTFSTVLTLEGIAESSAAVLVEEDLEMPQPAHQRAVFVTIRTAENATWNTKRSLRTWVYE